jgi:bacteriocin-like protein
MTIQRSKINPRFHERQETAMLDQIFAIKCEELTNDELNAISGGKAGEITTEKPGISASMVFGDQKLTVFASADCHGLIWSPR